MTRLFKEGKSFTVFPLRVYYLEVPGSDDREGLQAAFSAPKKLFRKAVSRNRLKRQMREAYRLNKAELHLLTLRQPIDMILIYYSAVLVPFTKIEQATQRILCRLVKELSERNE